MKIHIVQKGETIWEISEKYGVDFETVKDVNPQISSPDMIMPGMKIKIPSSAKQVKHKEQPVKETPKEMQKENNNMQPKETPKIDEDDVKKPEKIEVKPPTGHKPILPIKPSPHLKVEEKKPQKMEQQPMQKEKPKKEEQMLKEKKQPQMPSFNELPELELKGTTKMKPKCEQAEHMSTCCCCCCKMQHHWHMPSHMMGCHPSHHSIPHMHPGQMMMQPQQHMGGHPGYMRHEPQRMQPSYYYGPSPQPNQPAYEQPNNIQHMQSQPRMIYDAQQHMGIPERPFPREESGPDIGVQQPPPNLQRTSNHDKNVSMSYPQPPLYPEHPQINN